MTNEPTVGNGVQGPKSSTISGSLVGGFPNTSYSDYQAPFAPDGLTGAFNTSGPGDWDTGPGMQPDGPYVNPSIQTFISGTSIYFEPDTLGGVAGGVQFTPNRLVASPVKFGSLPTGVGATKPEPWQTLAFCPNPASRTSPATSAPTSGDHPGFANPPDHLYLEFFTMPTVEPYAISEPLSTAGKVNLNYQLAPFTSIERSTALRGVLKNTQITGICGYNVQDPRPVTGRSGAAAGTYKLGGAAGSGFETRYDINRDATLAGLEAVYFNKGNIFRYPSEICDLFLVPQKLPGASYHSRAAVPPTNYSAMAAWWGLPAASGDLSKMNFTGDNLREEPYDRIYPRVTTKSNTFTVHYCVQVLSKRTNSDPMTWEEGKDLVVAESRGATMIERYIDPADSSFDDTWDNDTRSLRLTAGTKVDLTQFYKFRIISNKKFAP
jgi:uncharacterized protein (TIGR02600 family)